MKIAFIGAGNMASSMIRGMVAGGFRGSDLLVYDHDAAKLVTLFEDCGVCMCGSGVEAVSGAETVVIAVKPQVFAQALPELAPALQREQPLVISIGAGKSIASIEALIGGGLRIVRTMPNMNAKVGESVSAFCGNRNATEEDKALVRSIFESFGAVFELEERLFSAFSVMAACAPAYCLLFLDALATAGVKNGLPKQLSLEIAAQVLLGSARVLQESGEHPRILIDQICSPGGTTIEGIAALQEKGFEAAVQAAVSASYEKDKSFS